MQNSRFQFPSSRNRLFRRIVIAAEGTVTEPEYFSGLNSMKRYAVFELVENLGNGSDPSKVLARMRKHLRENPLLDNDEAWIVIDKDKWPETASKALAEIDQWVAQDSRRHCAMSIRKFEDWLKLHVDNDSKAQAKYQESLSGKTKQIPDDFITKARVFHATAQAKKMYRTPKSAGNVYEIIESFFRDGDNP